jgi:hypothetical protein
MMGVIRYKFLVVVEPHDLLEVLPSPHQPSTGCAGFQQPREPSKARRFELAIRTVLVTRGS